MLGAVGNRHGFVDEKHWDAVLDAIRAAKAWVVEKLVVDERQWPAVLGANEDAQQPLVQHG